MKRCINLVEYEKNLWDTKLFHYTFFSSLKISLNSKKQKIFNPLSFLLSSVVDKKLSRKQYVFIISDTSEKLINFVKIFTSLTVKFKVLNSFNKYKQFLQPNTVYLASNNNLNFLKLSERFMEFSDINSPSIFSLAKLKTGNYFFIEKIKKTFSFKILQTYQNRKKNITSLYLVKKEEWLSFNVSVRTLKKNYFLNFFNFRFKKPFKPLHGSFKQFIEIIENKIILIVKDNLSLKKLCKKIIGKNFIPITDVSTVKYIIKALKKFNSDSETSLIVYQRIWKDKHLFDRIDPRKSSVLFKINEKIKGTYKIKSFFF